MMLNLGARAIAAERLLLGPGAWAGPAVLAAILLAEVAYMAATGPAATVGAVVGPRQVALALYGPYVLGVELASMLLLAGLVGAYHLGSAEAARTGEWRCRRYRSETG